MDWQANRSIWPNAYASQFVQTIGQHWHVQVAGKGPTLLLLHGTGASTHSWRDVLPLLSAHFTVVCPDLPGHAFSASRGKGPLSLGHMSRSLGDLLEKLGVWPAAIVGHSAGAAIAARLISDHAERPTPVLVGLNPAWLPLPGIASWLFPSAAKVMALNPWSARWFSVQAAKRKTIDRLIRSTGSHLDEDGLLLYQRLLQAPAHVNGVLCMMASWRLSSLPDKLAQLQGPVFMHLGANDLTIPTLLAEQARKLMPHAELLTVPGLGHLAHEEDPVGTSKHIISWVRQTVR